MGLFSMPWGLTGALLATTYLHSLCASASPSINVAMKASFASAPYLLELLETAGNENATSYFPLLDRIADGYFSKAATDKELFEKFVQVLKDDGHMLSPETLSSWQFALSMRASAPRIEAHYQYYHTAAEPSLKAEQETSCPVWVLFNGKQYCSPALDTAHGDVSGDSQIQELQFDRVLGNPSSPASILYADITSPTFGKFHKTLVKTAREGKTSYRIRHRKSLNAEDKPLIIPGYGVELALKRTDYIVIDDREESESKPVGAVPEKEVKFEDEGEEFADLKPLSSSELFSLGLKASSFILQSENPLDSLVKLSQDFPKYSSAIASHNVSSEFVSEHEYNRAQLVPAGGNIIWMNGVQLIERQIEALDLLDIFRKERKLINGVRDLGLTGSQAIQLLSHEAVATVKAENEPQRFDWRDDIEGGNIIIWMNNIEKDKRYEQWPTSLNAFLQRVYPGQLPTCRRDAFNVILPVDFTNPQDVLIVADTLLSFVKRKLAIRIGLVPLTSSPHQLEHAKVVYHLLETYGISAALAYLEAAYTREKLSTPTAESFKTAIGERKVRTDKTAFTLEEVLEPESYKTQIEGSQQWIRRLAADSKIPPMFIDGVALPRDENWLQSMSQRVTTDLQVIQQAIYTGTFEDDSWLPSYFLVQASTRRNALIVPEDEKTLKIFDVNKLVGDNQDILNILPRIEADSSAAKADWAHMILIADLESKAGEKLLATAAVFREANPSMELVIVHNAAPGTADAGLSNDLYSHMQTNENKAFSHINDLTAVLTADLAAPGQKVQDHAIEYWHGADPLIKTLELLPGQNAILLNGRLVGPIPTDSDFDEGDFAQLLSYERAKRITPAHAALEALGLSDNVATPLAAAKISSIVAISTISDTPDGIFEQASTLRMSQFGVWNSTHTSMEIGDASMASIHLTVLLDPASQVGQKWVPILKVLSELDGVYMKLFLNPKERLQELPVKRFYRYVLDSKPTFDDEGALLPLGASFKGVPQEALLNLGMDIPPAWLVAPKVSIYDLDNIKLSSIKTDVEALYELENILIEGHSREIPGGAAPRGVQLTLGTERDPHTADTIIMSNLGYFQFKANPGYYKIDLLEGRSAEIFNIDSVGSKGWSPTPGDENTEVVLMSFKGATLYPRISRKLGMEIEDVLETKAESKMDFVSRGLNFAQGILGKGTKSVDKEVQADINIFSVASGHLYERMLNIMMVSVMKHTKHTVKFWFIEQFLSPSFKDFIPYLAAEYGFKYEMVTYKWPHWLRAQTEKQREIWGYKILFLDVLFPLSLDKVIFVDADQIVRTDMMELVNHDLKGAPYGFTPMCDSRTEMEGFRFWKQGYWEKFLRGLPYHISALYVVDLHRFRQIAAGDRLRQQYHQLSADPNSLSNLDQDLPNHMQTILPIHSLPQEWLWCETWCSDEALKDAKTIDLCNNPQTKEPKLDRARRQVPEWTVYDDEIAAVDRKRKGLPVSAATAATEKNTKSRTLEVEKTSTVSKKDEL
ncbi:UDP-glucose:glycoprotein glucosyltransferase-domain-containing protein [Leptodontidium sp. 2 PMI_412]|nr:UDP-glucose:glycoprotein glucosyltransferase-domain-containing protein [Leptodontidium sp. MPI-SDFR-AT-0119]KAH9222248.1 UDP-glucose:glycoprotein glucosyltransferase-domain-containing protein [Leptodontidium sp. 2 PMI_412]